MNLAETIHRHSKVAVVTPGDCLIDVSRLVWRAWSRRPPTGIDRVCLAYLEHFRSRAQAVVQRSGHHFILGPGDSDRLFQLLLSVPRASRLDLVKCLGMALPRSSTKARRPHLTYLNVGHTGLNEASLPEWVRRNQLRAVFMVHDLIPITHPEYCRRDEAQKHARRIDNIITSAIGIIVNSQATLDELGDYARAKGQTLPPTVASWISGSPARRSGRTAPSDDPYFLVLGTVEGRKNHQLLFQIWTRLVAERGRLAPVLVVIGRRGWQAEAALARLARPADFQDRILWVEQCEDEELAAWMSGARALLMPSFAEGFGLPVIEALQLGTPVIASALPVFREIGGGIPILLDPRDAAAWQAAIESFALADSPARMRQLAAMQDFEAPSWQKHFVAVEAWLDSL